MRAGRIFYAEYIYPNEFRRYFTGLRVACNFQTRVVNHEPSLVLEAFAVGCMAFHCRLRSVLPVCVHAWNTRRVCDIWGEEGE